jgi:tryptophanyl-tRNA synthetase
MSKPVILTGLRANNDLTIGNYLGALLPMIDMAKAKAGDYQINLFVPDLHSFTTPIDHTQLQGQIMQNLKVFVAAGLPIDHSDVHIYRQSYVPAHSELTWILDCFTGFGEMSNMTQFKDKSKLSANEVLNTAKEVAEIVAELQQEGIDTQSITVKEAIDIKRGVRKDTTSMGLFNYPVLMAADILLYNASYVPVGEDQTQHLEFTRDIAMRLNNRFGEIFTIPIEVKKQHVFFGKDQGLRIKDLIDPSKKMSKSDETGRGVIFMSDSPETAAKKIMGATTDTMSHIGRGPDQPGITNLLDIYQFLSGKSPEEVIQEWYGQSRYGDFKKAVAEVVSSFLRDFQTQLEDVDENAILLKLRHSEAIMNETANATLLRAQKAVGLRA